MPNLSVCTFHKPSLSCTYDLIKLVFHYADTNHAINELGAAD